MLSAKRGGIEANRRALANEDRFSVGVRGWAQATFLLHSRFEAISAPARNVASLAHTTTRWRSTTATFIPAPARWNAKDGPAWPAPMMIASKSGMNSLSSSRRRHYNNQLLISL